MKFSVGKKIGLGFIVVGLLMLAVFSTTMYIVSGAQGTLEDSIESNEQYTEVGFPTVTNLKKLDDNLTNLGVHVNNWVFNTTNDITPLLSLNYTLDSLLPADLEALEKIVAKWDDDSKEDLEKFEKIKLKIQELTVLIDFGIRDVLVDFESKTDPTNFFMASSALDEIKPGLENTSLEVKSLLNKKNEESAKQKNEMNSKFTDTSDQFSLLFKIIILALITLGAGTFIIAIITTRSITKPVHELKDILINLGKGIFPRREINPSNDEIGEMSVAMNQLVVGLKGTTNFANEVGKSNFNTEYKPLSDEDVLGHALVKMRDELAESERILEQKVIERTAEVVRQKEEIERQSEKLEELYEDVTASIRYAKRLQDSILPQDSFIQRLLPESFVLFKPKDIVSGDFYWFSETENKVLFSSVDCTGHGVPGAFMSLIGANALNQIVSKNIDTPSVVLDELNRLSSEAMNKSEEGRDKVRDGMDVALCAISKDFKTLEYAGANNPLYIIRDGEIEVTKADKFAIASFEHGEEHYSNHTIDLKKGDLIYIFSDGYADQFGGDKGKKFMYKQFRDTLLEIIKLPMHEQKAILDQKIESWRGDFEQVDDILVIGVRI